MKKRIIISLGFTLFIFIIVGCSSQSWPDPPDLSAVDTLCLKIEKSRSNLEDGWIYNDEDITRTLTRLDLELVEEGQQCDATLVFDGKGVPKGSNYESSSGTTKYCYTGGSVNGEITLSVPGHDPYSLSVKGNKALEESTSGCPKSPPYYEAVHLSMLEALNHMWGPDYVARNMMDEKSYISEFATKKIGQLGESAAPALLDCLWYEDLFVAGACARALVPIAPDTNVIPSLTNQLESDEIQKRLMAAVALGVIGPDAKEAIPNLILILDDDSDLPISGPVSKYAADALESITGESFGNNIEAWQEWVETLDD